MKQQYILQEYSELILPYTLTDAERAYLHEIATINPSRPWEKRFFIDELTTGLRIQTVSYVGTIELDTIRLIIQPKFDKQFEQVIDLMLFAKSSALWQSKQSSGTYAKNGLFEQLVALFADKAERLLRQGLKKDYVTEYDNLKTIRGRVLLRENSLKNFQLPKAVYCAYDELTYNIIENQAILAVLQLLSRQRLTAHLRQIVMHLRSQFEQFCQVDRLKEWPMFVYNRLNNHYKDVHILAELLFKQLFVSEHLQNTPVHMAFLVDMNALFEQFVVQLLKQYLPSHFTVTHGKRVTNAILLDGQRYRDIIPDIVVTDTDSKRQLVIDTKYKGYDKKRVATADIFQLAFYAQYFQQEETYYASIIYPLYGDGDISARRIETNKHAVASGYIMMQSISIHRVMEAIKNKQREKLQQLAWQLIQVR